METMLAEHEDVVPRDRMATRLPSEQALGPGETCLPARITLRPGRDDDLIERISKAPKGALAGLIRESMRNGVSASLLKRTSINLCKYTGHGLASAQCGECIQAFPEQGHGRLMLALRLCNFAESPIRTTQFPTKANRISVIFQICEYVPKFAISLKKRILKSYTGRNHLRSSDPFLHAHYQVDFGVSPNDA